MSTVVHAKKRKVENHSALTELRQRGFVPAVVYGYKTEATPITINAREYEKALRLDGKNSIVTLEIDGEKLNAVLNEAQKCALKGTLVHLDFLAVNMSDALEVSVPVNLTGDSLGAKEGGILQQPNREVTIKVKPSDIPESIEVDISTLEIGDTLAVGDIRSTSTFEILDTDDFLLVTVSAPTVETESTEVDEKATSEEIIGAR
ncbi:50S ribosomal protein L25/general stress protein Ctc [Viridibacillus sp. FSL R5-0477]|uniref:Large ribosomal subunit protein bL25 n=1 Tax=Viridibacillus arenosi FSL R5-213 TaxID=1227360 RepID=W4F626_9BACL|nr:MULTISPECIES: 50S ribosomal protein L25/general stress protein Ctc [Viridibacillus]ETT88328.1 50S ribosomal protein L25 [Viridibacillus arenosi FSL R5-213]OMC78345.1 50S ribosomal protein L25/general stress protein Ctc [Viridibacillus sp. FSL H8-0123]OMC81944.1 50S ribosomal protein L25/general stress protein Ctc [Viridibacillus sp. FSL H7-0596]OMC87607.1 50S ribosomal protein L25/general stress protein Ctc [Viridibacillus arenosi]